MEWIFIAFLGVFAGTIGSLVGLGGGVFIVPTLLFLTEMTSGKISISPQEAVGISLFVIIVTALSSTISYKKQNRVDFQSGLLFFLASGPGAIVGAYITGLLDVKSFNILFGLLLLLLFFIMMKRDGFKKREMKWSVVKEYMGQDGIPYKYGYRRRVALLISFFVGMISSMFGIGGGSLMVPAMVVLFSFPPHVATATSMFIILLSALVGSLTHLLIGSINWMYAGILAPGAWIGGRLGAYLSGKFSAKGLVISLQIILIVLAAKMIWSGL
ncbi:sulfite exporter TauE/SafE family protein [Microaerobacter geothermalis]|uniref:sulfite exporter TauE/SafE family protein n=1 Tax=Microaerobacter geothermalis TaxID=674972 RepID=UPI001F1EA68C|nr:sulfite exporter TauE/SafE family protein [Microaerobacter geothermalis]MCF6092388.1 sulfite exporter TauE/SafE family protein [Microaerobacter geothermalis]